MRKALLVMAHGSPDPSANSEMIRVVDLVRDRGEYQIVEVGFLDCNQPDIPTAIESCVNQAAESITGVPYFLHTGKHVADDIPTLFEQAQARYPDIVFRLSDYLGHSTRITEILSDRAGAATSKL